MNWYFQQLLLEITIFLHSVLSENKKPSDLKTLQEFFD